jgi:hypothetical protein
MKFQCYVKNSYLKFIEEIEDRSDYDQSNIIDSL